MTHSKKYLFIGAHTDDIELSCGGTIAKLIEQGHDVRCYVFSYCDNMTLLLEHQKSMNLLGVKNYVLNTYDNRTMEYYRQNILDDLTLYKQSYYPDYVFTHDETDLHQDHRVVALETLRAFKFFNVITYINAWNAPTQSPNYFIPITKSHLDLKISALQQYESQSHRAYMYEDMIVANTTYWTNKCPFQHYAEAFTIKSWYEE